MLKLASVRSTLSSLEQGSGSGAYRSPRSQAVKSHPACAALRVQGRFGEVLLQRFFGGALRLAFAAEEGWLRSLCHHHEFNQSCALGQEREENTSGVGGTALAGWGTIEVVGEGRRGVDQELPPDDMVTLETAVL